MQQERNSKFRGMYKCIKLISSHIDITLAGQKRKNDLNMSRILKIQGG